MLIYVIESTRLLSLGALLILAGSVAAAELNPGIIGSDDRVLIEDESAPWSSIGQINVSGYRSTTRCTGTLIRANAVVTAAHCLWLAGQAVAPVDRIHFVAGLKRGSYKAHARARCLRFLDGWGNGKAAATARADPKLPLPDFARDAVVIVLDEPLALTPVPVVELSATGPGALSLAHAAYPADRRHALSADNDCGFSGLKTDLPLWLTDCDTHPASSGGPVLVREGTEWKLAAIMVGAGSGVTNVALPASEWRTLAESATCP